jgi:hypothetical protein
MNKQLEALLQKAGEMLKDAEFKKALLLGIGDVERYSLVNRIIILSQKPNATMVKGFKSWNKVGRRIKKGEKAILIFAPLMEERKIVEKQVNENGEEIEVERTVQELKGFRRVPVFDISQTEGPDIATPQNVQDTALTKIPAYILKETLVEKSPIRVEFRRNIAKDGFFHPNPDISQCWAEINEGLSDTMQARSIVHQLAHFYHFKYEFEKTGSIPDKDVSEVIAESVSYMILGRYGIDVSNFSIPFMLLWAEGNMKKVMKNLVLIDRVYKEINALIGAETEQAEEMPEEIVAET